MAAWHRSGGVLFSAGRAVWVTDNWSIGFFHWFGDVLPKLEIVEATWPGATIVLPHRFAKAEYVTATIGAYRKLNFVFAPEGETLLIPRLVVVSDVAPTGHFDTDVVVKIRTRLIRHFASALPDRAAPGRPVYISRAKAARRRIVNDAEVSAALAARGFLIAHMEELALTEQVRLMAQASAVVAMHGAGLTNILFLPPGRPVVEIRRAGDDHHNCYFTMAASLGLPYHYLLAPEAVPDR